MSPQGGAPVSALVAGKAAEVARSRESACHDDILLYHTILLNASTRKMAYIVTYVDSMVTAMEV